MSLRTMLKSISGIEQSLLSGKAELGSSGASTDIRTGRTRGEGLTVLALSDKLNFDA